MNENEELRELPKILIVDDDSYEIILYKEHLGEINYEFYDLNDGDLVSDFLVKNIPDLIILDWQMPRIQGLSVLKMIRNNRRFENIPIIVITGLDSENILEQAFDYGANDFLFKPVNEKELIVRVQNVLRAQQKLKYLDKENIALGNLNEIIQSQNQNLQTAAEKNSSVHLVEKVKLENLINKIEQSLENIKQKGARDIEFYQSTVREILNEIKDLKNLSFESGQIANKDICRKLLKINPTLTTLNLQHCSLLSQNLRNDEIARLLFVERKTLQTKRYRIKKKLGLGKEISLQNFLMEL